MDIVRVGLRLNFTEAFRPWLELRGILRAAHRDNTMELRGEPIVVTRAADGERIALAVRGITIETERAGSTPPSTNRVIDIAKRLSGEAPFPSVASLRWDSAWIAPFDLPFHELVARMKTALLTSSTLTSRATDIQVVVDEQTDDAKTNHLQIGPMLPAQLNDQILFSRRKDLPNQFIFLGLGRTITKPGPFKIATLSRWAPDFDDWARSQADSITQLIRG